MKKLLLFFFIVFTTLAIAKQSTYEKDKKKFKDTYVLSGLNKTISATITVITFNIIFTAIAVESYTDHLFFQMTAPIFKYFYQKNNTPKKQ